MSAHATRTALAANPLPVTQKTKGFLRIVPHGAGSSAIYIITYHKLDMQGALPKPTMAEGAEALIDLLEKIGVELRMNEVRGALQTNPRHIITETANKDSIPTTVPAHA